MRVFGSIFSKTYDYFHAKPSKASLDKVSPARDQTSGGVDRLVSAADYGELNNLSCGSLQVSTTANPRPMTALEELSWQLTEFLNKDLSHRLELAQGQSKPTLEGVLLGKLQDYYPPIFNRVLGQSLKSSIHIALSSALQHLSQELETSQARAKLIQVLLTEVQLFLKALKNVSDQCARKGIDHPTDEQILSEMRHFNYDHYAIANGNVWSSQLDLKDKAQKLTEFFVPRLKAAIREEAEKRNREGGHDLLTLLSPVVDSTLIDHDLKEHLTQGFLASLETLMEQLSNKAFWRSSINALLDVGAEQLRTMHRSNLHMRGLSEMDEEPSMIFEECAETKVLAESCAKTTTQFFDYIPLLDNLQTFVNKLFYPIKRAGAAWSESVMAKSMERALRAQLDITADDWISHCIDHLVRTNPFENKRIAIDEPVKEHLYHVFKGAFRTMISGPFYLVVQSYNWVAGKLAQWTGKIDQGANSVKVISPFWRFGKALLSIAVTPIIYFMRFKPVIAVLRVIVTYYRVVTGFLIAPFAGIVTGQVETRLEDLSKSPIREVFVHRLLDRLMKELHLNPLEEELGSSGVASATTQCE